VILFIVLLFPSSLSAYGLNPYDKNSIDLTYDLDDFILQTMRQKHLPGLSTSLVINDNVV
jgi:hypothetical protein